MSCQDSQVIGAVARQAARWRRRQRGRLLPDESMISKSAASATLPFWPVSWSSKTQPDAYGRVAPPTTGLCRHADHLQVFLSSQRRRQTYFHLSVTFPFFSVRANSKRHDRRR